MRIAMRKARKVVADTEGTISINVFCCNCNYNLRGLLLNGKCPECGVDIECSLKGAHKRWRATLGFVLALAGVGMAICPFVLLRPPRDDLFEFGGPLLALATELVALPLTIVARRYEEDATLLERLLTRIALCISVLMVGLLGAVNLAVWAFFLGLRG